MGNDEPAEDPTDDRENDADDPFNDDFGDVPTPVGIKTNVKKSPPTKPASSSIKVQSDQEPDNTKKKPARERRFFKNRTKPRPVNYQFQIHSESPSEMETDDTFKKPCLPGPSQTSTTTINSLPIANSTNSNPVNDLVIPVSERLSQEQSDQAELADDVTYYLEGVKSSQGNFTDSYFEMVL